MKNFFSRRHDAQTGSSKSASRDTYKFWIPNADPDRESFKPNRAHENVIPVEISYPHAEKRSSSRAAKHPNPVPVLSSEKTVPSSNTTAAAPVTQHTIQETANRVPSSQHPSVYTQPLYSAVRPSYSARTRMQQQIATKGIPQVDHSRMEPISVQHEVWLPPSLPSTSRQAEEFSKLQSRIDPLDQYRPFDSEKDRPNENGKRDRERERAKEKERDRRKERDFERERVRQQAKDREQESVRERERTKIRDKDRERELVKDTEKEQERLGERERRERDREKERVREKERDHRAREREIEKQREKENERERGRELRDKNREREKYRELGWEKERARYHERERRERENNRTRERDHDREKDRGREGDVATGSPYARTRDRVAEEAPAAEDDLKKLVHQEKAKAELRNQSADVRREKERATKDPYKAKRREGEHKYRAEATDGEQDFRRTKPRTLDRERQKDYHPGWISDTHTGHERKTSRPIPLRGPTQIDEGENSDNSAQVRITNRMRQRHGRLADDELLIKNQPVALIPATSTIPQSASNQTQSNILQGSSDLQPPISSTPIQMSVHLPPKDLRTSDKPVQPLGHESLSPTNETPAPPRREINRMKLSHRQDTPPSELPELLLKSVDTFSIQRRPPSRTSASVVPQNTSNAQSVISQPLRSGFGVIQAPLGPNQRVIQQRSAVPQSMADVISKPANATEQIQAHMEWNKERNSMTGGILPRIDSLPDKNGMQNVPYNSTMIPGLQSSGPLSQTQLALSAMNNTIPRANISQIISNSPKSGKDKVTAVEGDKPEVVKQISLAEVKYAVVEHEMDGKHEPKFSSLSPPLPPMIMDRYPSQGRKESVMSPAPLTPNNYSSQPSRGSIEDTRPTSRAQQAIPRAEAQSSRFGDTPEPYRAQHLYGVNQKDIHRQSLLTYGKESVPVIAPSPSGDYQINLPSNTSTSNIQNPSVAKGQGHAETSVLDSSLRPLVSSNGVGQQFSASGADIPQTSAHENGGLSIPRPPTKFSIGKRDTETTEQPESSVPGLRVPSGELHNLVPVQLIKARLHPGPSVASSTPDAVNRSPSLDGQAKIQKNAGMHSQSSLYAPGHVIIITESKGPHRDHASPRTTPMLESGILPSPIVQPNNPERMTELITQKIEFDHANQLSHVVPSAPQVQRPESSVKELVGLSAPNRPPPSIGAGIETNSWPHATTNSNGAVDRRNPLGLMSSNSGLSSHDEISSQQASENNAILYPGNSIPGFAIPEAGSLTSTGDTLSVPSTMSQNAANSPRREGVGLSLRSEILNNTPVPTGGSSSPAIINQKKYSPNGPPPMVDTSPTLGNEAQNVPTTHLSVLKEESPKAVHRERAHVVSLLPVNNNLQYQGLSESSQQDGPRVHYEIRPSISPRVTSALNAEHPVPQTFQRDHQIKHVVPAPHVQEGHRSATAVGNGEPVSDPKNPQVLTSDPPRYELESVPVSVKAKVLHPNPFDARSEKASVPVLSSVPATASQVEYIRRDSPRSTENSQGLPSHRSSRRRVLDEDEEEKVGPRPAEYGQNVAAHTDTSRGAALGPSNDKESPNPGFLSSNFSPMLNVSIEQKVAENKSPVQLGTNTGTDAEIGQSSVYRAGKAKNEMELNQNLRTVSGQKNPPAGENRYESLHHSQIISTHSRKGSESNRPQNMTPVSTYKISHPVLAELLSSPAPTKQTSIVPSSTTASITHTDIGRPSTFSGIKADSPIPIQSISEVQLLNADIGKTQSTQKISYVSQSKYTSSSSYVPPQDVSTQALKGAPVPIPTSRLSNVQPPRPAPQATDMHPFYNISGTPAPSNQPLPVRHTRSFKQDDLQATTSSLRPDVVRTGTNATQATLVQDGKVSVPSTSSGSASKDGHLNPSGGYYSSKTPSHSVEPRVSASSYVVSPPNQPNRHQHSASFPVTPIVNSSKKDGPSRARSPVVHQSQYTPFHADLVRVDSAAERTTLALPKASSEETILMTPSSLANSTMLKPTASRQSVAPVSSQIAKKGGIFNMFKRGPQLPTQTPQQYEIWHPNASTKTPDSSPGNHKSTNANAEVQSALPIPPNLQGNMDFSIPIPIHGGDQPKSSQSHVFTPFRYLTSKRNRAVSVISMEAQDGTAANTVVGSPTASMHSQAAIIPPPVRDPLLAAAEWRNKEEADAEIRAQNKLRRQRPGVVFDVDEEMPEDGQQRPRRRGTRYRRTSKEAEPPPDQA